MTELTAAAATDGSLLVMETRRYSVSAGCSIFRSAASRCAASGESPPPAAFQDGLCIASPMVRWLVSTACCARRNASNMAMGPFWSVCCSTGGSV